MFTYLFNCTVWSQDSMTCQPAVVTFPRVVHCCFTDRSFCEVAARSGDEFLCWQWSTDTLLLSVWSHGVGEVYQVNITCYQIIIIVINERTVLMKLYMLYIRVLYCAAIPRLTDRREQLSHKFFKNQFSNPHLASVPCYLTHGIPQLQPDWDQWCDVAMVICCRPRLCTCLYSLL